MKYLTIVFIFLSYLCNLVNARIYAGGAVGISIGSLVSFIRDQYVIINS